LGSLRPAVIEAVYNEVILTMGGIAAGPYEGIWSPPEDAAGINSRNRMTTATPTTSIGKTSSGGGPTPQKTLLVDLAQPYGFNHFHLLGTVSSRSADQWLNDIRSQNHNLYLQEAAENSVPILVHWRDAYGIVPIWHQPFNEPLSG
jgi:hypothetical protein